MRKLMTAVTVLVGLSMAAGCRSSQDEAQAARQDMAEADQRASQDVAEAQQNLAERTQNAREDAQQEMQDARADAQKEMQEAQQQRAEDRQEAQQDLNDAQAKAQDEQREEAEDARGTGGSGPATTSTQTHTTAAATKSITGTLAGSMGKSLTVKDAKDAELKLDTDDNTRVLYQGKQVKLDDFEKGTRLSATYEVQGDKKLAREVTITAPAPKK